MDKLLSSPLNYLPVYLSRKESTPTEDEISKEKPFELGGLSSVKKIQKKLEFSPPPPESSKSFRNVQQIDKNSTLSFFEERIVPVTGSLKNCFPIGGAALFIVKIKRFFYICEYPLKEEIVTNQKKFIKANERKLIIQTNLLAWHDSITLFNVELKQFQNLEDFFENRSTSIPFPSELKPVAISYISKDLAIAMQDGSILILDANGNSKKEIEPKTKSISILRSDDNYLISINSYMKPFYYKKKEDYNKAYSFDLRNFLSSFPTISVVEESTAFFGDDSGRLFFYGLEKALFFTYLIAGKEPVVDICPFANGVFVATKTKVLFFSQKEHTYSLEQSLLLPSNIKSISFLKKIKGDKIILGASICEHENVSDQVFEFSVSFPMHFPTQQVLFQESNVSIGLKRKISRIF